MNTMADSAAQPSPGGQDVRAQFEAWAKSHNAALQQEADDLPEDIRLDTQGGAYVWPNAESAWLAWQAALAATGKQQVGEVQVSDFDDEELQFYREKVGNLDSMLCMLGVMEITHEGDYTAAWKNTYEAIERLASRQPVGENPAWRDELVREAYNRGLADGLNADRQPVVQEPVAWMTHHDEPMLFPTAAEAAAYCEDDEQPVPLYRSPEQAVDLGDAEPMFYIQDTRQFVGNCPMWWGPNGSGYVTRLDEAGRYTEQEAINQNRTRDTDVPWPCAEIDALARKTVDCQHMRTPGARLAELALIESGKAVQS